MELLLTIRDAEVIDGEIDVDTAGYRLRTAARAVVFDDDGQIALLHVGQYGYHKLPGGGIEEGEDREQALNRELSEEIGCEAEIISEVGEIVQYLDQKQLRQTSYCYVAKQVGEKRQPDFTDEEIAAGFEIIWAKDINEAIQLLEASSTDDYSGKSIVKRDLAFLQAAKHTIEHYATD